MLSDDNEDYTKLKAIVKVLNLYYPTTKHSLVNEDSFIRLLCENRFSGPSRL
jgi:hypothetical protein